jgi:hypothetical protein
MITFEGPHGLQCELTEEERRRLCSANVARLQGFRANPPPAPPQKDYKAEPLKAPLPVQRWPARKVAKFAAHVEAKYGRKYEPYPVRLTSIAPCPPNSAKPS